MYLCISEGNWPLNWRRELLYLYLGTLLFHPIWVRKQCLNFDQNSHLACRSNIQKNIPKWCISFRWSDLIEWECEIENDIWFKNWCWSRKSLLACRKFTLQVHCRQNNYSLVIWMEILGLDYFISLFIRQNEDTPSKAFEKCEKEYWLREIFISFVDVRLNLPIK